MSNHLPNSPTINEPTDNNSPTGQSPPIHNDGPTNHDRYSDTCHIRSGSSTDTLFDLPTVRESHKWSGTSASGNSWAIYHGSALQVLQLMPDHSVNCVVTSPPYFWLRDYHVAGQLGMENTIDDYVNQLTLIMTEVRRVLRNDGVAFFNIGDTFYSGKGESQGFGRKEQETALWASRCRQERWHGNRATTEIAYRNPMEIGHKLYRVRMDPEEFNNMASTQPASRTCSRPPRTKLRVCVSAGAIETILFQQTGVG